MEQIFTLKVKQLNEFVKRFNYEIDLYGKPIGSEFESKISRDLYLSSLFNKSDARFSSSAHPYQELQSKFVNLVIDSSYLISRNLSNTIALAKSIVLRNGLNDTLIIELKRESLGYGMYKWVIVNVINESYVFQKSDTTGRAFLSPTSNETNFISLQRALNNKDQLLLYTASNYGTDNLSFFIYELYHGIISFKNVIDLSYEISDIPGWVITVKEFKRTTSNSGWLIDDIRRNP